MVHLCDFCKGEEATIFCFADQAVLCNACDQRSDLHADVGSIAKHLTWYQVCECMVECVKKAGLCLHQLLWRRRNSLSRPETSPLNKLQLDAVCQNIPLTSLYLLGRDFPQCWTIAQAWVCHRVHNLSKAVKKHERVSLQKENDAATCDICQENKAIMFCSEDRALICRRYVCPDILAGNDYLLTWCNLDGSDGKINPEASWAHIRKSKALHQYLHLS